MVNGGFDHHLRALRRHFAEQIRQMSDAFAKASGINLTHLAGGFVTNARWSKASASPSAPCSPPQGFQNFIRLNCGHPWSALLDQAVERLAAR